MNRIYRLVFNRQLGVMQVASELARRASTGTTASPCQPLSSPMRPLALCMSHALLFFAAGSALAAEPVIFNGNDQISTEVVYADGIIVGSNQEGTLTIVDGGHVTADDSAAGAPSLFGQAKGSVGRVIVDGPDAWLKITGEGGAAYDYAELVVGEEGTGELRIVNGGRVEGGGLETQITFARLAGSSAGLVVDGSGSLLQTGYLLFGGAGTGSATVSNGGRIAATRSTGLPDIIVAESPGSQFRLDVLGTGSELTAADSMYLGRGGSATLNIQDGARADVAGTLLAAEGAQSTGDITVSGAGSSLRVGRGLTLAQSGQGSLTVTDGATVTTGALWTSYYSGSSSTLLVEGAGSTVSTGTQSLLIGRAGTSDLSISQGGQVLVGDAMIGTSGGSSGTIVVDGASSKLTASGDFTVGDSGSGELIVRNGGQVSAASMILSDALTTASDGTVGKVSVDGQGSALTIADDGLLTVGGAGNGTFEITNGGHVTAGHLAIGGSGSAYTPSNVLSISGAASALEVKQDLRVGSDTNGRLQISDGAQVVAGSVIQGEGEYQSDTISGGVIEIDGQGTRLTAGEMDLRSQFTLKAGAAVSADTVTFANAPIGSDTAVITGPGTTLTVKDAFAVAGNVDVTDGAVVQAGSLQDGYESNQLRGVQLRISGAGSTFTSNGDITFSSPLGSSHTILLSDAGYLSAGSHVLRLAGTSSELAFGATGHDDEAQAPGQLDAGTSIELDQLASLVLNHTANDFQLANTLASVGYNASANFAGSLLSKAGTTRLTGDLHAFNGDITVQGGKLVLASDMNTLPPAYSIDQDIGEDFQSVDVTGNGALVIDGNLGYLWQINPGTGIETRGSTDVTVRGEAAGQAPVLAGSGRVAGTVRVGDGGVISPGDGSSGTFTIDGDLYFTGVTADRASVFAVDVKSDGTSDKLMVTGVADLRDNDDGATPSEVLVAMLDPATSYQNGQQYTILHADGGVQDTFSSVRSQSAFLTPTLTYTPNDVVLTLAMDTSSLQMTVGDGQTLSGNDSYSSVQVLSGGRLSPGTSDAPIGMLTFNGDLSFAAGAFYDVDLRGTADSAGATATSSVNDLINVTGKATLSGGTVQVTALDPQTSYQDGHSYTILHADGGVAGNFAEVTSKSAFLVPTLSYTANDVAVAIKLTTAGTPGGGGDDGGGAGDGGGDGDGDGGDGGNVSPPPPIFETVANSRNQYNVAVALDTLPQQGDGLALYNRLLMLDADSARAAFGSLSGEIHTAVRAGLLEDRFVREGVGQRLAGQAAASGREGIVGWISGSGVSGRIDGDGNAAKMQGRREGILAGVDFALGEDSLLGLAGGHQEITRQVREWESDADIDADAIGLYAASRFGALQLHGGVDYTDYDVRSRRQAVVGTAADTLRGDYDAHATAVYSEAGWTFGAQALSVTPYLNVAYTRLETDGVTESGGSSALEVASSKDELLTSTLGARLAWDISEGVGDDALLVAGLAWQNASGELKADNRARFVAGSEEFRSYGTPLARNVGIAEVGVGVNVGGSGRVSLAAQGRAGDGQREFGAQLNWQWRF
jgi:T5SS/PEP-CTERM-associated repeat protein